MAGEAALEPERPSGFLLGVTVLTAGFIGAWLGLSTLMPGVGFWDTAEFQTVGPLWGTAHPTGFPAYVLLGWVASILLSPAGDPALRMNMLSALLAGFAAGAMVVLVTWLTGRLALALASAMVLVATPVVWSLSNHADPHMFHVGLVAVVLAILVGWGQRRAADRPDADRWLIAAAGAYGVAAATHSLVLLLAPGIVLYALLVEPGLVRRSRFVATCAVVLVATVGLLYATLPIRALAGAPLVYGHPDRIEGLLQIMIGSQFGRSVIGPFDDLGAKTVEVFRQLGDQLGILLLFVPPAIGAVVWRQPRYGALTIPAVAITCWFAASYDNADISRYYAGPVLILITWIAILAGAVLDLTRDLSMPTDPFRRRAGGAIGATLIVAELCLAGVLVAPTAEAFQARIAQVDRRTDRRAQAWLDELLPLLQPNATVLSWWSLSTSLWYAQLVQGERPDIWIVDDRTRIDEHLGSVRDVIDRALLEGRPVYVIRLSPEIADLSAIYELEPVTVSIGSVYRVVGRLGGVP